MSAHTAGADAFDRSARRPSIEERAARLGIQPVRSADDLVRESIFESDADLDAFLADLHVLRHSDAYRS